MWPFTPKTVYDKYKKLIQLLISIDPKYMEITKKEPTEVYIQSNREDNIVDFTIKKNFDSTFKNIGYSDLTVDFVTVEVLMIYDDYHEDFGKTYPQNMKQSYIFQDIMFEINSRIKKIIFTNHKDEIADELEKMKLLYDMFVK